MEGGGGVTPPPPTKEELELRRQEDELVAQGQAIAGVRALLAKAFRWAAGEGCRFIEFELSFVTVPALTATFPLVNCADGAAACRSLVLRPFALPSYRSSLQSPL